MTAKSIPSAAKPAPHAAMANAAGAASASRAVEHVAARVDLAAAFRWFARLNMHESVANHLSVAVSADGAKFLINPRGRHFARICAGDLLLLDANDPADSDA